MTIAVHPNHQRKGIGRQLLDWGTQRAAKAGKDVYLISMPDGKRLYLGAGFEQVGVVDVFGQEQYQMVLRCPPPPPKEYVAIQPRP
jgi:ribosomal protein S18 acetylase RimI-like enzyme